MRIAVSIGLALGLTLGNIAFGAVTPPLRDKWALLVGVDAFQDPLVKPLKSNANNVAALSTVLKDPFAGRFAPDHVMVLTGSKATKSGIERAISDWLEKKALPDDLVVIYISSASIQGPHGEPMVFSYDTLGSEPELSGLDMNALATDLKRRIQSRNIVLLVDSSPATKTAPDFAKLSQYGVTVISATSGNQKSITNGALDVSLFEHHVSEAIKHGGGTLTLRQAFDHIAQTVAEDAKTAFHSTQTPVLAAANTITSVLEIPLGTPVKSSMPKHQVAVGHPIDQLALSRPDLMTGVTKPAPKPAAKDDDDDDDDKPPQAVDFGSYMSKMKQDIQKHWQPPKGLESRRLVAVFTIMRDGKIINPTIVEGSGVPSLDKSALDALSAASPLDPLPPGSPRSVDIKYKFDWNVKSN